MDTALMVRRMALRALDDVAEPLRRADIGMLEQAEEGGEQVDDDRRIGADTETEHQRQAADKGEAKRVERMEIERAPDVDALGAVVHLVEPAPQERRVVHRPMPSINAELEREETTGDLRP